MNVLIIPEDFRKDQFLLKPLIKKMLAASGKPKANVQVCMDPLLGGVGEAMKWERIQEIVEMYGGMVQLFLLIVDRDGKSGRRASLNSLEARAIQCLIERNGTDGTALFLAENAWQEIEVWALAGMTDLPKQWKWRDIRSELNPKEVYFEKYAEQRALLNEPGQGRTTLGREAAKNYSRIRSLCPEDVGELESRIKKQIAS